MNEWSKFEAATALREGLLMTTDPRVATREDFCRLVQTWYPGREEELAEYVAEAEHGDGLDYWAEYGPAVKLAEDFDIYLKALEGE